MTIKYLLIKCKLTLLKPSGAMDIQSTTTILVRDDLKKKRRCFGNSGIFNKKKLKKMTGEKSAFRAEGAEIFFNFWLEKLHF